MKLIMTKGLPASGKSTWAKSEVVKSKGQTKRINKDDLRGMIDAGSWSKSNEKYILQVRDKLIQHYLSNGFSVIVDDTNLAPKHETALAEIAQGFQINFEVKSFLDVPLKTCIVRDLKRDKSVGERVIRNMYNQFVKPVPAEYQWSEDKPNCIIVDIDGTLAHMSGRSPYDYSQVHTDTVDELVREIVWRYSSRSPMDETPNTYIIIVSGRPETCRAETEKWLQDNQIPYDELHMRDPNRVDEKGNMIDDRIIKREIYDKWIKDRFNVRFVLDDRDRVVEMWRGLGLKVLQVAEGDF